MAETNPKTIRGQFKKGTSGNPSGRPTGSRNRATLLAEQCFEGEADQLSRKMVDLAKKGNIQALRFCLERVLPTRKERSIELELLPARNAQELAANYQSVVAALSEGRITPGEAQSLTEVLDRQARVFELVDMEPGQQLPVTVEVDENDSSHPLSYWDTGSNSWQTAPGTYTVYLGNSAAQSSLQVAGTFQAGS